MMRNKIGFQDCVWWVKSFFNIPIHEVNILNPGTKIFRMSRECVANENSKVISR